MFLRSISAFKSITGSALAAKRSPPILSRWVSPVVQLRNLSALPQPTDKEPLPVAKDETLPATFASLPLISPKTLDALNDFFKYKTMTDVQHQVLSLLPTDQDLLVRAKTGTGKTLAFLIAALESALARNAGTRFDGKHVPILIISPTRELALQITAEAKKLTQHHRYTVMSVFGGTKRSRDMELFDRGRIDILVATPGRLKDLISSESIVKERLSKLETVRCLSK
jgi:ATP-dependent RNA helicase MSS116